MDHRWSCPIPPLILHNHRPIQMMVIRGESDHVQQNRCLIRMRDGECRCRSRHAVHEPETCRIGTIHKQCLQTSKPT